MCSSNEDPSAATCGDGADDVCGSGATSITFKYFNPIDECDLEFFCGSMTGKYFMMFCDSSSILSLADYAQIMTFMPTP